MIEKWWWMLSLVNTRERCFFLQSVTQAVWKKKTRVLPIEVKPVTFWATGDLWELRPLKYVHVTNILRHTPMTRMLICVYIGAMTEMWWWILSLVNAWERCFFSRWHRLPGIKNLSTPNRSWSYDLLITRPDALPLSYRRLVVAKAIKQFSGGVRHHQPSKPLMAYDDWWRVSGGFQCAIRLRQFWRMEEWERGKMRKLKSNKVLWKKFKECGLYKQKGCKVLHTLCCTRSTALIYLPEIFYLHSHLTLSQLENQQVSV